METLYYKSKASHTRFPYSWGKNWTPPSKLSTNNMTTSRRVAERKIQRFEKNVTKRGTPKKNSDYTTSAIVLGLFVFALVGSYIFQMIRTATYGGVPEI